MAHVAVVTNLYPPFIKGGYELLAYEFVRYCAKQHRVSVLTSALPVDAAGEDWSTVPGVEVVRSLQPSQEWDSPPTYSTRKKAASAVQNAFRAHRFFSGRQVTHAFFWNLNRMGLGPLQAALHQGISCFSTLNDYYPLQYVEQRRLHRRLKRCCFSAWPDLSRVKHTYISAYLRDDLARQGFAPEHKQVIFQGIDVEKFPLK
ncbi:MAG: glycosyltransferase [Myxococcota bacterium]